MNNDIQTMLYLTWILMALSGVFMFTSFQAIRRWLNERRRAKEYPGYGKAVLETMCKGPHSWDSIKLALGDLPVGTYSVCTSCGFISSEHGDLQLNAPGIEVYRNELRLRTERQSRYDTKNRKKREELERIMNRLVKDALANSKGWVSDRISDYGDDLQQFFRKTVIELDSLYDQLNKELEEEDRG